MKKATLLFVFAIALFINAYAQLSESFEGTFPPANWYKSTNWSQSTSQAFDGTKSARCMYNGTNDTLITPTLNLASGNYYLNFYWKELNLNNTDSVVVSFSTDNGQIWYQLGVTGGGSDNIWTAESFFVSNPSSPTCKIMWNYLKTGSQTTTFYLDKVEVSTSTNTKSDQASLIEVYPNPISNNSITINNLPNEKTSIQIVNVLGKTIYESVFVDSKSKITIPFEFESGIYFINVKTPNKQFSKKLIQL
ncbi:MAG: T9SS type A sorting domain-containing protein [Bacteroidota bacterium]